MATEQQLDVAATMFRALSDPLRLKTLILLAQKERSVGELSEIEGEKIGTMSARLKVLLTARLVRRRKDGQNAIYSIADNHVLALIDNAIDHACEHH
ncbi:metalloregulator ArsR/SmtB family transcription factor [Rhizobium sp. BK491]|uniref:ArsR/SmtB family transcription factor n=1 Tax=Rhizobium sp. BK491 TaxID=2587009 RepID=UPI00180F22DA|nr:metalloregulator ArsR/SmtB family transcription factor [Rhizobium sp. BK491]MBB3571315.1 ArsR family transcriptional regulator [Rhizobium sp. BK491]